MLAYGEWLYRSKLHATLKRNFQRIRDRSAVNRDAEKGTYWVEMFATP